MLPFYMRDWSTSRFLYTCVWWERGQFPGTNLHHGQRDDCTEFSFRRQPVQYQNSKSYLPYIGQQLNSPCGYFSCLKSILCMQFRSQPETSVGFIYRIRGPPLRFFPFGTISSSLFSFYGHPEFSHSPTNKTTSSHSSCNFPTSQQLHSLPTGENL